MNLRRICQALAAILLPSASSTARVAPADAAPPTQAVVTPSTSGHRLGLHGYSLTGLGQATQSRSALGG